MRTKTMTPKVGVTRRISIRWKMMILRVGETMRNSMRWKMMIPRVGETRRRMNGGSERIREKLSYPDRRWGTGWRP